MSRFIRTIRREIAQWQAEGLITSEQAALLLQRYPVKDAMDWGRVLPMAAGGVIFGLGVILFFAYNWQGMHRFVKLACIGGALVGVHGAALWFGRRDSREALSEGLHVAGTMLFGAGIWLVAQIYHIDEYYPNAFLIWSIAALGMAWALPSLAQALLAVALVFMWGCFEIFDFNRAQHPASWVVAAAALPLAFVLRSNLLLFFATIAFVFLHAFSLIHVDDDLLYSVVLTLASATLAVAKVLPREADDGFQPGLILRRTGMTLWIIFVFVGTFANSDFGDLTDLPTGLAAWVQWGVPAGLAIGAWVWVYASRRVRQSSLGHLESAAIIAVLAVLLLVSFNEDVDGLGWVVSNVAFAIVGGVSLRRGLTELRWGLTALGTVMLGALVFARFMDLFDSLLLRSAVFVLVGVGLFVVGQIFNRRQQSQRGARQHA